MSRKRYADVTLFKTTDPEGHFVIDSKGVSTTFYEEGTMTFNSSNGVIVWSSGDITHINMPERNIMMLYDAETDLITITHGDEGEEKNLWIRLTDLIAKVITTGISVDELAEVLEKEKEKIRNGRNEGNEGKETDKESL